MKVERNILVAFVLNLLFSLFEFVGGIMTGSVAIFSDAVHDFADAFSIGLSFAFERKSNKKSDFKYTYGYKRYSPLAALITTVVLITGSILVIISAIGRILNPVKLNYNGMIILAIIGVLVNFVAACFTHEKHSLNQRAVHLHMLEDVLGWVLVLIGSILMKFTDISIIDSILSIVVSAFILIMALKNLKDTLELFLEKAPNNIPVTLVKDTVLKIDKVIDVHHIHIWTMDGINSLATLHVVSDTSDFGLLKKEIRKVLKTVGISHVTIEVESNLESCKEEMCKI